MTQRVSPDRSTLRLADLKQRVSVTRSILNVKVPSALHTAISKVATHLKCSRTQTVVALLNEGLAHGIKLPSDLLTRTPRAHATKRRNKSATKPKQTTKTA